MDLIDMGMDNISGPLMQEIILWAEPMKRQNTVCSSCQNIYDILHKPCISTKKKFLVQIKGLYLKTIIINGHLHLS